MTDEFQKALEKEKEEYLDTVFPPWADHYTAGALWAREWLSKNQSIHKNSEQHYVETIKQFRAENARLRETLKEFMKHNTYVDLHEIGEKVLQNKGGFNE